MRATSACVRHRVHANRKELRGVLDVTNASHELKSNAIVWELQYAMSLIASHATSLIDALLLGGPDAAQ